jgi:hypothetical protein
MPKKAPKNTAPKTFKSPEEVVKAAFPGVWKKREDLQSQKERRNMSPRELAESVMSAF